MIELERRGCEIGSVRTREGHEVIFFVEGPEGETFLIQPARNIEEPGTWEREERSLVSASADYAQAVTFLVIFDSVAPREPLATRICWSDASV